MIYRLDNGTENITAITENGITCALIVEDEYFSTKTEEMVFTGDWDEFFSDDRQADYDSLEQLVDIESQYDTWKLFEILLKDMKKGETK